MKVVITGGTSGIGLAMAKNFASRGYEVHVTSRTPTEVDGLIVHKLELNDSKSIDSFVETLNLDKIDLFINNAGNGILGPLTELTRTQARDQFETNVFGPLELVSKLLSKLKGGHLVNVSSISPEIGLPFGGIYTASKAAMNTISDILRLELAHLNITVTTLRPGLINTNFVRKSPYPLKIHNESTFQKFKEGMIKRASMTLTGTDPNKFADYVCNILLKKNCPHIIYHGKGSRILPFIAKILPYHFQYKILLKKYNLK